MPHTTESDSPQRRSLKANYIIFSIIIAATLATGAAITSFYITDVTKNNAQALQLRDAVTKSVNRIRKTNQQLNSILSAMLISPDKKYPQQISSSLQQSIQEINHLRKMPLDRTPKTKNIIEKLHTDTLELQRRTEQLVNQITDPNWVYPMLPFINNTLLESNTEFESATTLALQEIAEEDGDTYSSASFREIAQIRDLWRLQILNFRAVIVRFAGLNQIDRTPQEANIDLVNKEIRNNINKITHQYHEDDLGFETKESLAIMSFRAKKWYDDYTKLQEIRRTEIWRADVHYIETTIYPIQTHIREDLEQLELAVLDWSSHNTAAVENAAFQANLELWGMTAAAVLFVIFVYLMISRTVLTPIREIADAITEEGKQIEHIALPNKSSHEIHALMTAYNTMRRQIHHRQMALEYQALHDSLTSLPNRALLQDRLEQAVQQAKRHRTNIAFMLLDLDRFKNINDTLGHAVGDQVLQETSLRLNNCLRTSDTVARLGGDEFAIISPDVDSAQASFFIDKIINEVEKPIVINDQNMNVGVSVGITLFPDNGEDADTMMRQADIAMYDAKRNKKGFSFFHSELEEINADSLSLLGELKDELNNPSSNVSLYYQPKVSIRSKKIHSVEALLRWHHPKNGTMPPDEIVRMCEQSGLITELTQWVLDKSISECKSWEQHGLTLNISVNLSMWNLQDGQLPNHVSEILTKHDFPATRLTLEITESAVMNDPTRARETLTKLSNMGIQLDIDDYGTGFSSLAYLKILPVNGLKIDKSFVIDMLEDENDDIIVQSTIDLAHNLNLIVIAEGVESAEALHSLEGYRCDLAQGYFIARPMPTPELIQWCQSSTYST